MTLKIILQQVVLALVLIAIIAIMVIGLWPEAEVHQNPGVLAKSAPVFSRAISNTPVFKGGYELQQVGTVRCIVRVLQKHKYYYIGGLNLFSFDREAAISSHDIVVGWKEMSDEDVLKDFRFYLQDREYSWKPADINDRLIVKNMVEMNTALFHLIPSAIDIEKRFEEIKVGNIIQLDGAIMKVTVKGSKYTWGERQFVTGGPMGKFVVYVNTIKIVK